MALEEEACQQRVEGGGVGAGGSDRDVTDGLRRMFQCLLWRRAGKGQLIIPSSETEVLGASLLTQRCVALVPSSPRSLSPRRSIPHLWHVP